MQAYMTSDSATGGSPESDSVLCKKPGDYICDWKRSECQESVCGF